MFEKMVVLHIDNKSHANEHRLAFDIRALAARSTQTKLLLLRNLLTFSIAYALRFILERTSKTKHDDEDEYDEGKHQEVVGW